MKNPNQVSHRRVVEKVEVWLKILVLVIVFLIRLFELYQLVSSGIDW
ncbi:MAG: hypothetical protein BroJett041_23510 [Candidatus Jettenia caeni]|nr:MAG: hypothetical protein BroJett041_23510 [Candidatus Jettenia caeni]